MHFREHKRKEITLRCDKKINNYWIKCITDKERSKRSQDKRRKKD